jgi:hypothetical protein
VRDAKNPKLVSQLEVPEGVHSHKVRVVQPKRSRLLRPTAGKGPENSEEQRCFPQ